VALEEHDRLYKVAFSPDANRLASAGHDQTAVIWDAATGKSVRTIKGLEMHVPETERWRKPTVSATLRN